MGEWANAYLVLNQSQGLRKLSKKKLQCPEGLWWAKESPYWLWWTQLIQLLTCKSSCWLTIRLSISRWPGGLRWKGCFLSLGTFSESPFKLLGGARGGIKGGRRSSTLHSSTSHINLIWRACVRSIPTTPSLSPKMAPNNALHSSWGWRSWGGAVCILTATVQPRSMGIIHTRNYVNSIPGGIEVHRAEPGTRHQVHVRGSWCTHT